MPDNSTVSRRQKTLQVTIGAVPTTTGLHLLVDSTGIKLPGKRVMAPDFDRQVAELQARAAVLHRLTRLGPQVTVPVLKKTDYRSRQLGLRSICSTKPP